MPRTISRFTSALVILYLAGVCVLALQPLHTLVSSGYQGVLYKGGDESQYIMRIREAMDHPWSDVTNAIIRGPDAPRGLQMTFFEMTAGSLFSGTDFSAPAVAILLSLLLAPLTIPFVALLAVRVGASRRQALLGALLTFVLLLGPLRRVVHQAWSLPFVLGTLVILADWWREPTRLRSVVLGVLLGLVPGVYFWSWSFLWAAFGFTLILGAATRLRHKETPIATMLLRHGVSVGLIALVTATPFFFLMWLNAHHPEAGDATLRSSLIHAREFESVRRSVLFLLFVVFTFFSLYASAERRRTLPLVAVLLALLSVLHQQFVHGLVLSYWTHYYPYVVVASTLSVTVILTFGHRRIIDILALGFAGLFLLGAFVDYKGRLQISQVIPHSAKFQHLSVPLSILREGGGTGAVLSDIDGSLITGTYTPHDIVFSPYLRHTLVGFREFAERYCLTELVRGGPADTEWLARDTEEKSAAGRAATERALREHIAVTEQACGWVAAHPKDALKKYGVKLLLWDERNHPDWNVSRQLFTPLEKGAGWSLWNVRT